MGVRIVVVEIDRIKSRAKSRGNFLCIFIPSKFLGERFLGLPKKGSLYCMYKQKLVKIFIGKLG